MFDIPSEKSFDKNIDVSKPEDLQYWSRQLKCSSDEILEAVMSVGSDAVDVSAYLNLADPNAADDRVLPLNLSLNQSLPHEFSVQLTAGLNSPLKWQW
jgi:hypothetical protein